MISKAIITVNNSFAPVLTLNSGCDSLFLVCIYQTFGEACLFLIVFTLISGKQCHVLNSHPNTIHATVFEKVFSSGPSYLDFFICKIHALGRLSTIVHFRPDLRGELNYLYPEH